MSKIKPNERGKRDNLKQDENYYQYWLQREELLKKYPPFNKMSREDFKSWCTEIFTLIHDVDGYFQKFMLNNIPVTTEDIMERQSRSKYRKRNLL